MSAALKHVDACLPITALKTLDSASQSFILQGQGSFFRIIEDRTGEVCAQIQIFKRNNVHGFIILPQQSLGDGKEHVDVIVWGGRSVRTVKLTLVPQYGVSLSPSSAEFLAPDWIMSGCAAVKDQPKTAYLVTANNAVLTLNLGVERSAHYPITLHVHQLATTVKTMLFSADILALSTSHVLVAAGTVFGEIIVWSCYLDGNEPQKASAVGSIHHFFTGHDGSIFGVRISPMISSLAGRKPGRLLASCSDDRTVRVWDISDCESKSSQDPSAYATDGFDLRSTGFGHDAGEDPVVGSESCIAKAFGHVSRIWSVHFRPLRENLVGKLGLVTRGEDCTCIIWDLNWDPSSNTTGYQLREVSSWHHHTGKHIWSLDLCARNNETAVYTGGADGSLKSFMIKEVHLSTPQQQKTQAAGRESKIGIKAFDFVAPDRLIGCSQNDELRIGTVSAEEDASVTWETIHTPEDVQGLLLVTGIPQKKLALIGSAAGSILLYNHSIRSGSGLLELKCRPLVIFDLESRVESDALFFLVIYPTDDKATFVKVSGWKGGSPQVESVTFSLPLSPFAVCSACLANDGRHLVIGAKLGGLVVYQVSNLSMSSQPLIEDRRVHGHDSTRHIRSVSSVTDASGARLEYLLTCGRDGNYCLHEMRIGADENTVLSFETVHRTSSALGGNLEGAYFDQETGDLMIYGFRSQNFVLRNESKQTDLVSIASGGARRSWTFNPSMEKSEPTFSWKQGSCLRTVHIRADLHHSLRAGTHGREIKSMDALQYTPGNRQLFATGAEDTEVRVFALTSPTNASPWGAFECMRVLDAHKSGIQHVSWSKDGKYLFTSAAYEEFFVWSIRDVPLFGIATILMAASPKDDPNSDLRVTSFDLVDVRESENRNGYLLCLTLSNSTLKIFHFSPSDGGCFTLLARGIYMTNCLTEGHFLLRGSTVCLITAATDGYFTFWDLTKTLEPFYTISSAALTTKSSLTDISISPENITCENRYQIHSNSIKAMELISISDTATAIVTGGDDNSFSVSLLHITPAESPQVATVSIADAHAASVTTLKVLREQKSTESTTFIIASSGNDHRVKIWSVTFDHNRSDTSSIFIELMSDKYCAVADISSLGLIKDVSEERDLLLVCGVGMELFEINLE